MLFSGLQRFWSSVYHCHEDSSGLFEETQKSRKNSFCPCIACLVEMDGRDITVVLPEGRRQSTDSSKFKQKK